MVTRILTAITLILGLILIMGCENPMDSGFDGVYAPAVSFVPLTELLKSSTLSASRAEVGTGTAVVYMSTQTEGAEIFYTVNGELPDTSSTTYSAEFTIDDTTTIQAVAYVPGRGFSEVTIVTYENLIGVTYYSSDYMDFTPGAGDQYIVRDESTATTVWSIPQVYVDGNGVTGGDFAIQISLNSDKVSDFQPVTIIGANDYLHSDGNTYVAFLENGPSGYQTGGFELFMLPNEFTYGDEWSTQMHGFTVNYTVQTGGAYSIYTDCVRVDFASASSTFSKGGTGYFIVAPDYGIVYYEMDRNNATTVTIEYAKSYNFDFNTLSGTVISGGSPAANTQMYLGHYNMGTGTVTNVDGEFTIQVYGQDPSFYFGTDANSDGMLDVTPSPTHILHEIYNPESGITIVLE